MYQANQPPPVPYDRWDQSTYNPNLPHGNDVWPQLQIPPAIQPELAARIVSEFRAQVQNRVMAQGATPLHILTYNMLAMNGFRNQEFTTWCQRAVDFAEFLIIAQHNHPDRAVATTVRETYLGTLATYGATYPAIAQMLSPQQLQELQRAGEKYQDVIRDITVFQQNRHVQHAPPHQAYQNTNPYVTPQGQSYGYRPTQLPPVHQNPQFGPTNLHTAAPQTTYGYTPPPPPLTGPSVLQAATSGRYADEVVTPPSQPTPVTPVKPLSSWTGGHSAPQPTSTLQKVEPIAPITGTRNPTEMPTYNPPCEQPLDVPTTIDEVVVDPEYYLPQGVSVNVDRPYDVIHNPGGIEIRPAHLSGWTHTHSDVQPYSLAYDSNRFMKFHVRFPDGVVLEKVVELTADMEYLKHELDQQLRARYQKPEGLVVANTRNIVQMDSPPQEIEEVVGKMDDARELSPVVLDTMFGASTDLENENEALEEVIEKLGLDSDADVPAHEYQSCRVYPLEVSKDCQDRLYGLDKLSTLPQVANEIRALRDEGLLPLRYYRFIDQRLTKAINSALADNLSMDYYSLESFVDDVEELINLIAQRDGTELVTVLNSNTKAFVTRWLNTAVEETEDGKRFVLMEGYINLQTGWMLDDITGLEITDKPVLVSEAAHPSLHGVIREILIRNKKNDNLAGKAVRLITADGIYLEVIRGWLVEGSVLIKKQS